MTYKDEIVREIRLKSDSFERTYRSLSKELTQLQHIKDKAVEKGDQDQLWNVCRDIASYKESIEYYMGLILGMSEAAIIVSNYKPNLARKEEKKK